MSESLIPFDQEIFAANVKRAMKDNHFFDWISEKKYNRIHPEYQEICKALIALHNSKAIDLLEPVNFEVLGDGSENNYWMIQDLYCSLIPDLESHADPLMEAVVLLVDRGGNDLAANRPNTAFREWLNRRPLETKQLLARAQRAQDDKFELLTFVLEAGAAQNLAEYQTAAVGFLSSEDVGKRRSAVTALGRIDATLDSHSHLKSLNSLCKHAASVEAHQEIAETVSALLDVYSRYPSLEKGCVITVIELVAKQPTPDLHYCLARSLGYNHTKWCSDLQITVIDALKVANPSMKGVVDQLDFAFAQCINKENRAAISNCIEGLLAHPETPLDFSDLDSFKHQLVSQNPDSLRWLVIHWLRHGSHNARRSLPSFFDHFAEDGHELEFAVGEFEFSDRELLFVGRKALGYFRLEAATMASIIISCIRNSSNNATAEALSLLLFDPLMINFSGQARSVVERQANVKGKRNAFLRSALMAHDNYLAGLRSLKKIPESLPSASEQRIQAERQRQQFARSFKEAEKLSVFADLVTKQTLLHGAGSVYYMRSSDDSLHRSESQMSSLGTSIEFPRFETTDPINFQRRIFQFRSETLDP